MAIEQQSREWRDITVNGIVVGRTDVSYTLSGASNSIASNTIKDDINGKKVHIGLTIHTAWSAASAPLTFEVSLDGTNWKMVDKVATITDTNVVGTRIYTFDGTDYNGVPYGRVHFNGGMGETPGSIGTSGVVSFQYYITG